MTQTKLTFAIALAGALGATSMMIASTTTAEARNFDRGPVCRGHVHSMALAGGPFKPFYVKKMQARRRAIRKWRRKTTRRFGFEFRKWRFARARDVHFERRGPRVFAYIQGRPCARHFAYRSHGHGDHARNDRRNIDFAGPRRAREYRVYN